MKQQIPNCFTLSNLFLGATAILYILQPGLTYHADGDGLVTIPENMMVASWLIFAAALVDFLDGFVARWMNQCSEMGKQLDSLADVVSFGVAPGLMVLQFLRFSYASTEGGLDISMAFLLPALLIPCAGAYRLARFNLDQSKSTGFKGIPIPAAGILIASFPLVNWYATDAWVLDLLLSKWLWYSLIIVLCVGMVSTVPMLALKFSGLSFKKILPFLIILAIALPVALLFGWLAISAGFIAYVILSLLFKPTES
ncbi:MAG TPA: CDP-diacylglycerol--serine O-phosphatidyltransferase [Sediminibacterium sp.]|jgi:CDP-diacylglycerol--serine O-phosphatidyltransferase|uniref:CDP-diacylglycerol--serine O-phosphatidyltransferase n=1 Tax=Sediminibacterium sp. TaxID=1917865 RepID=UPI000BC91BCE|nr:CDP-diacylglycerol--serine O-phosphatidyltransferase [Sediminibacterium sp.]OYY09224.1 MAG: CDP-diacylglycerol--serine O-phosphatidyltransferase [Sphingobacteriia bacterium 35-36-14]OZA63489.1 MAG: CDP-diacylglycerol--serine O-phosphatidyltransferase [Sphingobacteriia bacterium 39-36-14]HQS23863.1 CDP-diacylglycerol--serine O-phosphatidyltransferase [Sediminibacterium sp.]HQS36183.1 CDP-diacylglycerol--serine O-phosphatidyltransferase [Sediminibacterium sp.]